MSISQTRCSEISAILAAQSLAPYARSSVSPSSERSSTVRLETNCTLSQSLASSVDAMQNSDEVATTPNGGRGSSR